MTVWQARQTYTQEKLYKSQHNFIRYYLRYFTKDRVSLCYRKEYLYFFNRQTTIRGIQTTPVYMKIMYIEYYNMAKMASSVVYSTCHVGTFCCCLTDLYVYIRNFSHCHTYPVPSLSPSFCLWCPSQQFPSPLSCLLLHDSLSLVNVSCLCMGGRSFPGMRAA